jgi:site-specific DNA-methyltransferase (adenine-specific)
MMSLVDHIKLINDDCLIAMRQLEDNSIDSIVTDPPYGISFMGKHWDYDVPSVEIWKEALRVLKPGGHILCACGTRTQHRMAVNIEDAGFEIRDIVGWVYGSGFPKSLNIGKAVDKLTGGERSVIGIKTRHGGGVKSEKISQINPSWKETPLTAGTSEWEGWGTALKPAMELWTLARKPLSEKSVAENVLKHGTGGINIDECRIATADNCGREQKDGPLPPKYGFNNNHMGNRFQEGSPLGRFPANFIHDGSDEVTGRFPNGGAAALVSRGMNGKSRGIYSDFAEKGDDGASFYGDSGSAARFFYCAKASKSERDRGLQEFEDKLKLTQMRGANGTGEKNFEGGFRDQVMKNTHPTVKPVALMRYLCRLTTPKGGTVLDPFMGSGSTGIGAKVEGFSFIGIEREKEYFEIAQARIAAWMEEKPVMDTQQKLF